MSDIPTYLKMDSIRRKVYDGIKAQFKAKHGKSISDSDIDDVVKAQSDMVINGLQNEKDIKLMYIGTLRYNAPRVAMKAITERLVDEQGLPYVEAKRLARAEVSGATYNKIHRERRAAVTAKRGKSPVKRGRVKHSMSLPLFPNKK